MSERTIETKVRTKLRLAVARLAQEISSENHPTLGRIVIVPCESDTNFGYVRNIVASKLESNPDSLLIPVLMLPESSEKRDGYTIKVKMLMATSNAPSSFWSLNADEIHDESPMARVIEVLDNSRDWRISEFANDGNALNQLVDLV